MASDRTARRLARILAMIPYIIEHDGAEVEDLVARFGYRDRADLVKDLHLVFVTGLPGYGPGDLIDVDIFDDEVFVEAADYFSRPLRLTPPEALGLLAAGTTLVNSDQAPPGLDTAIDKLSRILGGEVTDAVHFDVPTPELVTRLRSAIEDRKVVRIGYVGMASNERTRRDVEGWAVSFGYGNWYLTGNCRLAGGRRVFRVDRIDHLEVLDESYDYPESLPDPRISYEPSATDVVATFTVGPRAGWVAEYYPVDVEHREDGRKRITMSVSDPLVAARLLLQLGADASDVEGDDVLRAMDDLRNRILTRYGASK